MVSNTNFLEGKEIGQIWIYCLLELDAFNPMVKVPL
jgi:hypothetical protein